MLEAQGDLGGRALSYGAKAGSKKTSCVQGLSGPPFPHLQTVRPTSPPSGAVAERLIERMDTRTWKVSGMEPVF